MKSANRFLWTCLLLSLLSCAAWGQQALAQSSPATVPRRVNFSGKAVDAQGKTISGIAGVTFAIYGDQYEGAPLWLETQNVQADAKGNYTAQLGATRPDGLPLDLFSSGEARWLGVRINGGEEQPRLLLLSVPYALKAADAETIGGLPPSAFMLAAPQVSGSSISGDPVASSSASVAATSSNVTTTGGTINALPLWTTATNVQSSALTQTGNGTTAKIGIGTTAPATTLDVKGAETVRGALTLPATATATSKAGANSQPERMVASSFSSATSSAVNQTFQWQAEPAANNTASPSGTLNLLYGLGATAPGETGININNKGVITFAKGQTFPGTGTGTVTSVALSAPSSDFTVSGSPVTSNGTLGLKWAVAPTSANTPNAIVKRDGSGNVSANTVSATTLGAASLLLTSSLSLTSNTSPSANVASVDPSGVAILGQNTSGTGTGIGVYGVTGSTDFNSYGVAGVANNSSGGVPTGVFGQAVSGFGVRGLTGVNSGFYGLVTGAGVWGDGGGSGVGVEGTADDGGAGDFVNNSGGSPTLSAFNVTSGIALYAGGGGGDCDVDTNGNFACTGSIEQVVALDGGTRKVGLSAIESPKNWFEDFGSAQLAGGSAIVALDPDFVQTVNAEMDYHVFLTPNGDSHGIYVAKKTATSFEVREQGGGTSSIAFDYRIVALRKKYENVRFADHTNDPDPRKQMEQIKSKKAKSASGPMKTSQLVRPGRATNR